VITMDLDQDAPPVIVRAATVDLEEPLDRQRRTSFAIGADRRGVLTDAVRPRLQAWALQRTLTELLAQPETLGPHDVVVRRDWGRYGHLEVTIINATGPLPARYVAVSRLAEGERDVYLDALIDDALADRGPVARVQIGEPVAPPARPGEQVPLAQPAPADIRQRVA
jgi:hypothetical protein